MLTWPRLLFESGHFSWRQTESQNRNAKYLTVLRWILWKTKPVGECHLQHINGYKTESCITILTGVILCIFVLTHYYPLYTSNVPTLWSTFYRHCVPYRRTYVPLLLVKRYSLSWPPQQKRFIKRGLIILKHNIYFGYFRLRKLLDCTDNDWRYPLTVDISLRCLSDEFLCQTRNVTE